MQQALLAVIPAGITASGAAALHGPARFNRPKADWRQFKDLCNEAITTDFVVYYENIDIINSNITDAIISAAERCIPITKPGRYKTKHVPLPY